MKKYLTPIAILCLVLMVIVLYYYRFLNESSTSFLGFSAVNKTTNSQLESIFLTSIGLLVGIVCGAFHRRWREQKTPISFVSLKEIFRSPDLWRSIIAAPLLFSGVYAVCRDQVDLVLSFAFAFQSGFFCDSIVQKKLNETDFNADQ